MTDTATILVWVMAGLILLQTLGIVIAMEIARRKISKTRSTLDHTVEGLVELVHKTQLFLERALPLKERAPELENNLKRLLDATFTGVERADSVTAQGLRAAAQNLEMASRRVDLALAQFVRHTSRISRLVRYPSIQVSAVIQGAAAAFRELSRSKREASTPQPTGEEDFI